MRQAFSRASERATTRAEAFAEFHVAAGAHPISIEPARPQLQLLQGGGGS